jgi:hypothetical protein
MKTAGHVRYEGEKKKSQRTIVGKNCRKETT